MGLNYSSICSAYEVNQKKCKQLKRIKMLFAVVLCSAFSLYTVLRTPFAGQVALEKFLCCAIGQLLSAGLAVCNSTSTQVKTSFLNKSLGE